jgi:hypothetical protein
VSLRTPTFVISECAIVDLKNNFASGFIVLGKMIILGFFPHPNLRTRFVFDRTKHTGHKLLHLKFPQQKQDAEIVFSRTIPNRF